MDTLDRTRILVVDDEPDIREVLRLLLEGEGYTVTEAGRGPDALTRLDASVGLVILDVRMPGMDGYEVCDRIRTINSDVMILFLTAKDQEADRVNGLKRGGDDYLGKPFSPAELSARVDALLRRRHRRPDASRAPVFQRGHVTVDTQAGAVTSRGSPVPLTDLEYRLLAYLVLRAGQTVDARELYEEVWHETYMPSSSGTVMVHIGNLRRKLEPESKQPSLIKTVWGKGYRVD